MALSVVLKPWTPPQHILVQGTPPEANILVENVRLKTIIFQDLQKQQKEEEKEEKNSR